MTLLRTEAPVTPSAVPRPISRAATGFDKVFVGGARGIGATVLVITGGIGLFLAIQSVPTLRYYGLSFFTESQWQPEANVLGISSVLLGTLTVALVALSFAFPLSLASALYISEYAPLRVKGFLVSMVDLMAAVPSIIYGIWGFFLMTPIASHLARFLQAYFGWFPLFHVNADPHAAQWDEISYTASAFIAGVAVAMMVLPFGRGGIIGGTMLGLGRALGETIAVLLIISPSFDIKVRPLEIGTNTVSALIAGRFGEASAAQLSALLTAGLVLFIITLIINTLAAMIVARSRSGAGTDI